MPKTSIVCTWCKEFNGRYAPAPTCKECKRLIKKLKQQDRIRAIQCKKSDIQQGRRLVKSNNTQRKITKLEYVDRNKDPIVDNYFKQIKNRKVKINVVRNVVKVK